MGRSALRLRISGVLIAAVLVTLIAVTYWLGMLTPRSAEALDSEEQQFLALLNDYRAQNGLGPVAEHPTLTTVARWMVDDMGANNYFSHTDSLGRDPFQRMDQMGYTYNTWRGENLVAGTETAQFAFNLWKDSPGHNANMLGSNYTVIGIARVFSPTSDYGWYWATEFGGAGGQTPAPPAPAPTQAPPPQVLKTPPPEPVVTAAPAPPPAPTAEVTPEPTPSPTPVPAYKQTVWWLSLESVTDDWGAKVFAWQLLRISPALEELFVTLIRNN